MLSMFDLSAKGDATTGEDNLCAQIKAVQRAQTQQSELMLKLSHISEVLAMSTPSTTSSSSSSIAITTSTSQDKSIIAKIRQHAQAGMIRNRTS